MSEEVRGTEFEGDGILGCVGTLTRRASQASQFVLNLNTIKNKYSYYNNDRDSKNH